MGFVVLFRVGGKGKRERGGGEVFSWIGELGLEIMGAMPPRWGFWFPVCRCLHVKSVCVCILCKIPSESRVRVDHAKFVKYIKGILSFPTNADFPKPFPNPPYSLP